MKQTSTNANCKMIINQVLYYTLVFHHVHIVNQSHEVMDHVD